MRFFDAHAHYLLTDERRMKQMKAEGVVGFVYNGIDIKTSRQGLKTAQNFPGYVFPTLGVQPEILVPGSDLYSENYGIDQIESDISDLRELYEKGRDHFKAIGECGMDYYWLERSAISGQLSARQVERSKSLQKELFLEQITLAQEVQLPLVLHPRGAEADCLRVVNSKLKTQNPKIKVLFHSYTGPLNIAKRILKAGYYMSFNGILTFSSAENIREIFLWAWEHFPEQILSETDSPYLTPEPKRGEINSPENVRYVVEYMAELIEQPLEEVATTILQNAYRFYKINEGRY